jgi:hypothetical protein
MQFLQELKAIIRSKYDKQIKTNIFYHVLKYQTHTTMRLRENV